MRHVTKRSRKTDALDGVPAQIHEALCGYSRAVLAADDARRALSLACASVPGAPRMWVLEGMARRL
jgi:hypothetical protein